MAEELRRWSGGRNPRIGQTSWAKLSHTGKLELSVVVNQCFVLMALYARLKGIAAEAVQNLPSGISAGIGNSNMHQPVCRLEAAAEQIKR